MSIRYECEQCGSVLKIKDDLAGKPGKCPKCKTPFTVPAAEEGPASSTELDVAATSDDSDSHLGDASQRRPSDSGGDFDVDAFLLAGDDSDAKATSRAAKSSRPNVDIDAEQSLDEPDKKPKPKRSKSQSSDDEADGTFQIRRGPDVSNKVTPSLEVGDEPDEKPTPLRRPPGTNPNAHAANIASDLLSKSSKKGKKANWDEAEPEKKEKPEFDWDGLWYEARTKLLPLLGGGAGVCLLFYLFVYPMFVEKSYVPNLAAVTGTIAVNGKPLVGAQVMFHPSEKKQESNGKSFKVTASIGQTDASGGYELMYDAQKGLRGAIIGKCRVEVMSTDYTGINPKYFREGPEAATVEVKAGKQVIDLELSQ